MANRKIVTLRVSEHPQSDLINKWLDQQKNIQESITNIMLHSIERFGLRNITDYDIQRILYQESMLDGPTVIQDQPVVQERVVQKEVQVEPPSKQLEEVKVAVVEIPKPSEPASEEKEKVVAKPSEPPKTSKPASETKAKPEAEPKNDEEDIWDQIDQTNF